MSVSTPFQRGGGERRGGGNAEAHTCVSTPVFLVTYQGEGEEMVRVMVRGVGVGVGEGEGEGEG